MLDDFGWAKKNKGSADAFSGTALAIRCYESHPVLKLGKGTLIGGAARSPVVKNADVYVVLQVGDMDGRGSDPWEKQTVTEVQFAITDMQAPSNVPRFKKLVTWLCKQLQDGKTVHVGCIGGHGRTGTVLSAVVAEMLGEKNAIQYVRKHYCTKAVESQVQIQFLKQHYGVSSVEPTKKPMSTSLLKGRLWEDDEVLPVVKSKLPVVRTPTQRGGPEMKEATRTFSPMASARSLWKPKKKR